MSGKKHTTVTSPEHKVTIDGKEYTLAVTLAAVRHIDGVLGGLKPALNGVINRNTSHIATIIQAGAELKFDTQAEADEFTMKVFAESAENYYEAVQEYMLTLLRGGKPQPKPTNDDAPDQTEDPAEAGNG